MGDPNSTARRLPKRWLRFRLRTLFLVMAIIAVPLAVHMDQVRTQKAAVARIQQLGGWVLYEYQCDESGLYFPEPKRYQVAPRGPEWLRNWLGPHHFNTPVSVNMASPQVTDDDLAFLRGMAKLKSLGCEQSRVTSEGLGHLRKLIDLRSLYLGGSQVDDDGMKYVATLPNLETLNLDVPITDDGLAQLRGLTHLKRLTLNRSRVTDEGLKHLAAFENLETLQLYQTQVSDAGLEHVRSLRKLTFLDVRGTKVTEAGVRGLKRELPKVNVSMERPQDARARITFGDSRGITRLGIHVTNSPCTVNAVDPFSPASRGGIQSGDVIRSVDGRMITDADALLEIVQKKDLGTTLRIEIARGDRTVIVDVRLDGS
jgi:hypothetical protein